MITPADIDTKRFSTTRLKEGYDQDEVDAFLDKLQEDYAFQVATVTRLDSENATLRRVAAAHNEAPTAVLEKAPERPSVVAEKLLEAAQTVAEGLKADAIVEADRIVREAGARAAAVVEEAAEAAEKIKNEGLNEKYRKLQELDDRKQRVESALEVLNHDSQQVRRALQAAITSYDKEVSQ